MDDERRNFLLNESQRLAKMGSWETDLKNPNFSMWSKSMFDIFEIDSQAQPSNEEFFHKFVHPKDKENYQKSWDRILADQNQAIEYRTITTTGRVLYIYARAKIEYDENNKPIRLIGFVQDITERKQLEESLKKAKEKAEKSNEAKSLFLSKMRHELRTPLNGILGYTQLLKQNPSLSSTQFEGLEVIERSAYHLLSLINDILDITKIESKKITIALAIVDFSGFLQFIENIFRFRFIEKGLCFDVKISKDLPKYIETDEKILGQILMNLLSNALKFTNIGGVSFEVFRHHHSIRFQVTDTGIGIEPEQIKEIFVPFKQGRAAIQTLYGTGLGLSISNYLVGLMGSKLEVESTVNVGSKFWFDLHLKELEESCIDKTKNVVKTYKKKPKIQTHQVAPRISRSLDENVRIPTRQILSELEKLLKEGDILGFQKKVDSTWELSEEYHDFGKILENLAKSFDIVRIKEILQDALTKVNE